MYNGMNFLEFVEMIKDSARTLPAIEIDWYRISPQGYAIWHDPEDTSSKGILTIRINNYYENNSDNEFLPHIEIAVQSYTGTEWDGSSFMIPLYNLVGGSTDGFESATEFVSNVSSQIIPTEQKTELLKCAAIFDEVFFPNRVYYRRYDFVK
ncbi:hypothetical protein [Bacillus tuaregi]|uniref:hypothetical protein n=1 Tax=Bacillus tuaregi TaxID=1816695 RepID=UPI0008F8F441|nr:hypothetical protein [Bacillus tuaregi]